MATKITDLSRSFRCLTSQRIRSCAYLSLKAEMLKPCRAQWGLLVQRPFCGPHFLLVGKMFQLQLPHWVPKHWANTSWSEEAQKEATVQRGSLVLAPPWGVVTIWFSPLSSAGSQAPSQARVVTSGWAQACRPQAGWKQKADGWDSWNITLLPHHHPIRGGPHMLQPTSHPHFCL